MRICQCCGNKLKTYQQKYCSNTCQCLFQYRHYIQEWKNGTKRGDRGIFAKTVSAYVKRYLVDTFGEKCSLCGWDRRNPVTNRVTLEIDHLDGNSDNNSEENLRLICPNCHSLTPTFRNLNKGKGRIWRRKKYIKHVPNSVSQKINRG